MPSNLLFVAGGIPQPTARGSSNHATRPALTESNDSYAVTLISSAKLQPETQQPLSPQPSTHQHNPSTIISSHTVQSSTYPPSPFAILRHHNHHTHQVAPPSAAQHVSTHAQPTIHVQHLSSLHVHASVHASLHASMHTQARRSRPTRLRPRTRPDAPYPTSFDGSCLRAAAHCKPQPSIRLRSVKSHDGRHCTRAHNPDPSVNSNAPADPFKSCEAGTLAAARRLYSGSLRDEKTWSQDRNSGSQLDRKTWSQGGDSGSQSGKLGSQGRNEIQASWPLRLVGADGMRGGAVRRKHGSDREVAYGRGSSLGRARCEAGAVTFARSASVGHPSPLAVEQQVCRQGSD